MFVSGITIKQKQKKVSEQKRQSNSIKKKSYRPSSSQLPQIHQLTKFNTQNYPAKIITPILNPYKKKQQPAITSQDIRVLSLNKITIRNNKFQNKKNYSSKKQLFLSQQKQPNNNLNKTSLKQIRQTKQLASTTNKQSNSKSNTQNVFVQKKGNKKKLNLNSKGQKISQKQMMVSSTTKLIVFDEVEKQKISKYFRYYPIIFVQACNKRDSFMSMLNQYGEIDVYNTNKLITTVKKNLPQSNKKQTANNGNNILDPYEPWNKLIKIANLKGKYKYRQKFNFINSAQLKALNFKRKQPKKKKQSDSSSSDDQDKKQKCRDMETWKRSMGVQNAKVFIIKGKYTDLKNSLLQRGWVQNPDKHSSFFDFKWTTKVSDLVFESLKSNQIVNHFNNNACLTSKYGICKSLRSVMYSQQIDIDKFFPKAFDLMDCSDFQNFLEIYKWVYCESILKKFVQNYEKQQQISQQGSQKQQQNLNIKNKQSTQQSKLQVVKLSFIILSRRLVKPQTIIKNILNQRYFTPTIQQWKSIYQQKQKTDFSQFNQLFQVWGVSSCKNQQQQLFIKTKQLLIKLQNLQPQFHLNGSNNIWIVKPAFLSRGRGIKCLSKFADILNYGLGKETQYVVQKYIENPLIINKRKFDIRQWVLVEEYNPPKIWIYGEFYCRFCIEEYDETKLTNKFAHLTNNSIQKYNKNFTQAELKEQLKKSMWTQEQLTKWIEQNYGKDKIKLILGKMKEIVIATILSTQDQVYGRKNSFQLIGYDFMIDDQLNPWLIQINTSPAMDYSTPVTARLVKMVMQDTVKVVIDKKKGKKKTAGLYKCVYNGQDKFVSKYYNVIRNKSNLAEQEK